MKNPAPRVTGRKDMSMHKKQQQPESRPTPALDAFAQFMVGKLSGEEYAKICKQYGKEHWLIHPCREGKFCPSSGKHGIESACGKCGHYSECFAN